MTIESINKRIAAKQKEIEKLTAKAERIAKAKATGWRVNPYYYNEDDERYTARDIERAREALAEYEEMLRVETQKANSRDVAVIIEFLNRWKEQVTRFYNERFSEYPEALKRYNSEMKLFKLNYHEEMALKEADYKAYKEYCAKRDSIKETFRKQFGFLETYITRALNPKTQLYDKFEFDSAKLAKELEAEAARKYDFIIERTNHYVGQITDASNLTIGAKGDLNGFIEGTDGGANVQTVGAGGYNIQCFHFRTLIHAA